MSKASYGQVDIELGGEAVTLKPTLRAYEKIEQKYDGLRPAIQALSSMSLDAVSFVIGAATSTGQKDFTALQEKIFEAGVVTLMPKVTQYLVLLMNPTGKEAGDDSETSEGN